MSACLFFVCSLWLLSQDNRGAAPRAHYKSYKKQIKGLQPERVGAITQIEMDLQCALREHKHTYTESGVAQPAINLRALFFDIIISRLCHRAKRDIIRALRGREIWPRYGCTAAGLLFNNDVCARALLQVIGFTIAPANLRAAHEIRL